MNKEKTFSEMLHGDILWMKQQDAVQRMHRMGKTEMVLMDVEAASVHYLEASHYEARALLVRASQGYGRGFSGKRKMFEQGKVVAEINKAHPALAAEHRVGGLPAVESIAKRMKALRDWKKLNWAYYYGRANYDTQR